MKQHSKNIGKGNYCNYSNQKVDDWIMEARTRTEPKFRRELYQKIDKQILEDAIWSCLFYFKTAIVRQPYVTGINLTELGEHLVRYHDVSFKTTSNPQP